MPKEHVEEKRYSSKSAYTEGELHMNKELLLQRLHLHMFDNTNVTTQTGAGSDLSPEMKTYYSKYLIANAKPKLFHDQFGQKHPIPKNGGKTIEFRRYSALPKATTALTEGVTPSGRKLNVSKIESTVKQYGDYIELSDMLILTAIDNNMVQATELLGAQAGVTSDTITREIINAGTNVQYAGGVSNRKAIASTNKLSVEEVRKGVRTLRSYNTEPFGDGYYVGIISPDLEYDLMKDTEWVDASKYGKPEQLFNGEIGRIAGVRFVSTSEAKVWKKSSETTDSNVPNTENNKVDVHSTLILGKDAYGVTELEGMGLQHITKQLGSSGTADPLNQRATVGWKLAKTAEILSQEKMVRIESAASATTGGDARYQ